MNSLNLGMVAHQAETTPPDGDLQERDRNAA